MKRIFTLLLLLYCSGQLHASTDTSKNLIWAFPITSYIVPLKEGVQVVQVKLPPNITFIKDKQIGLLRGISNGANIDTGKKGYGKCHLIKGQYNYFSIFVDSSATKPKQGDLLYTLIPRKTLDYISPLTDCASHGITFLTVGDTALYTPDDFLKKRTKEQDDALTARLLDDIRYTARYYLKEDSAKNLPIPDGNFKGRKILDVMSTASTGDLNEFLRFVAARPRRYAGNTWKISETFATWLLHGAPMVVPD